LTHVNASFKFDLLTAAILFFAFMNRAYVVNISHTPSIDEHYSDFFSALNNPFKRARRQLGNKASRLQGETKHHEPQITGIVTKLFEDHGFVESENGLEIYFHKNSVLGEGFSKLKPGISVTFVEELGENGPQASTIKL
jgi:cold shock CspA family protein